MTTAVSVMLCGAAAVTGRNGPWTEIYVNWSHMITKDSGTRKSILAAG